MHTTAPGTAGTHVHRTPQTVNCLGPTFLLFPCERRQARTSLLPSRRHMYLKTVMWREEEWEADSR